MRHRFAVGDFVRFREPDEHGRLSNGQPMTCCVLEHLASAGAEPLYLVNEGCVYSECYEIIATEDEFVPVLESDEELPF